MNNGRADTLTASVVISLLCCVSLIKAQVVINEICWAGSDNSSYDEWIELYNHSSSDVDLTGWILQAADSSPEIFLSGTINAYSYFLLERTDDNSVSDITADIIYTGAMGNSGENLSIKNHESVLLDRVDCTEGWFAGDNDEKISMERIDPCASGSDPGNWGNNNTSIIYGKDAAENFINGTPRHKNSISDVSLPVFVFDLQAQPGKDCLNIHWNCQYLEPVKRFHLYRSPDSTNYTKIAEIKADPNQKNYHYNDRNIEDNINYFYKLKLIKHSGPPKFYGPVNTVLKKNNGDYTRTNCTVFPNPFNPATTIHLTLAEPDLRGRLCYSILDCLGREVAVFTRQVNSPGQFNITWDGRAANGNPVPSGIYLVRITTSRKVLATTRMMKLK